MKWWGWGAENVEFSLAKRPKFIKWAEGKLKATLKKTPYVPVIEKCELPNENNTQEQFKAICEKFGLEANVVKTDKHTRMLNTYGKSYPDLIRARRGNFLNAPDVVVYPRNTLEVEQLVQICNENKMNLVPFGGGTNIVGAVEHLSRRRPRVTLNLEKMNQLISVDKHSWSAKLQAGVFGPHMEEQLARHGFSLGHFPDSFQFSTLGGWIATRSAGMQSDAYGKIEDMVLGLQTVTSRGTLQTRPFPAASNGPDLNRVIAGSEGGLGVITEAVMQVHPIPAYKNYVGFLFKNFESGVAAIRELYQEGIYPSMIRLQDEDETEMAFSLREQAEKSSWSDEFKKYYLKVKGFNHPCLMIAGFEGTNDRPAATYEAAKKVLTKGGQSICIGPSVGATWTKHKYDVPYLRDLMNDMNVMCDVSETSTDWANLLPLYKKVKASVNSLFDSRSTGGFVGCHLSHSYSTGACLYFTWATPIKTDALEEYYAMKSIITDQIVEAGGTLSHHHAVGYEHKAAMKKELGLTGITLLSDLKKAWDPNDIFNTGKHLSYEIVQGTLTPLHPGYEVDLSP